MRKFRNAALAAATATAVAFGGASVATAQENPTGGSSTFTSGSSQYKEKNNGASLTELSSDLIKGPGLFGVGQKTEADQTSNITDLLGKKVDDSAAPTWALMWRDALNWLGVAIGIGAVIGLGNYALNQGLLPQIPW
nr:Uncharacterised protein [Streptococcus thermophilus]